MPEQPILIDKVLRYRIARGDEAAFSIFFHHYRDRVMQIAFYFTKSEEVSKDILQDVFVKVWNSRAKLADIEYPDAWVATIARNFTLSALRKVARELIRNEQYTDYLPNFEWTETHALSYESVENIVEEALRNLPEQQRTVFYMSKIQGLNREAIAATLNISPNTVKVHLLRATRFVRAHVLKKVDAAGSFILTFFFL